MFDGGIIGEIDIDCIDVCSVRVIVVGVCGVGVGWCAGVAHFIFGVCGVDVVVSDVCGEGVGWNADAAHCVDVVVSGVCGEGVGWYADVAHCVVVGVCGASIDALAVGIRNLRMSVCIFVGARRGFTCRLA